MKINLKSKSIICLLLFLMVGVPLLSQETENTPLSKKVKLEIEELMDAGDIPGLSVVIVNGKKTVKESFGYANLKSKDQVTSKTLFQLGSTSKAFTALAVEKLIRDSILELDAPVTKYLPWFEVSYDGELQEITVEQLLHHTSGIPWRTISLIPESNATDALEKTVKQIVGIELEHLPGSKYEYATLNYDILALVIEEKMKVPFESYAQDQIMKPLELLHTTWGVPKDDKLMATGYKVSFFKPREYKAPIFKGNNAAGYVVSNADDMAKWLKFQMGMAQSNLYDLAKETHLRDESVNLHGAAFYAKGWEVALDGTEEIYHGGLNPNFTSFIKFREKEKLGVAVLANSNSNYTALIADRIMKLLANEELKDYNEPSDHGDKMFSALSITFILFTLVVLILLSVVMVDAIKGRRKYEFPTLNVFGKMVKTLLLVVPFLVGLYFIPDALANFTWSSILVWTPQSMEMAIKTFLLAIGTSYLTYIVSLLLPNQNEYKKDAPKIILMSILSGTSNIVLVIMVTSAIGSDIELKYLVSYYLLALSLYLLGRRFVQISLIKLTRGIIYDLKLNLIGKLFSTSYQRFEKIDKGRIFTSLNDDVEVIGQSAGVFVGLITSIITAIGAFLYLASIAFWATLVTIGLIVTLASVYYVVSQRTNIYFEEARDEQNIYMRLLNGLIGGFKELSLQRKKKLEYKEDISTSALAYKQKRSKADIRFVNAFLVGESLLVMLLGVVAFGIPEMFPNIQSYTVLSFVIILLYLIGPINGILNAVPTIMYLKVAWNRIQEFLNDIPANLDLDKTPPVMKFNVESFDAKGLRFNYQDNEGNRVFGVGPIDFQISRGEIIFIIGGNGSGKTTLAKLLTGLYESEDGSFFINGKGVNSCDLGEYFSTVFSPSHLFEKMYNIDHSSKNEEIAKYLKILELHDKVNINEGKYDTIDLSGGQRKRLGLLQCFLEDSPIYLFDEWAADQDPTYRNFFYTHLLPEMKNNGKLVIAITHDDHYFDVADRVLKMRNGVLEEYFLSEPLYS